MISLEWIDLASMAPCPPPAACVLSLGNFDGVHLAHRALLQSAKELCEDQFPNAVSAVFCFRRPSSDYLSSTPSEHLSTLSQKLEFFRESGAKAVCLADFPTLQSLSPADFAALLREQCRCLAAVCGFNYRFGKNGAGQALQLESLLGAPVLVQPEITDGEEAISSTRIRRLLSLGETEEAARLLARPFSFSSPVLHGKALGHKLGAPTVNQRFPEGLLIPRHGVYLTNCLLDGRHYHGVSNVGSHPTVDAAAEVNCETYLLDCSGDLYGKEITVSFLKFLRPEKRFASKEALMAQIQADISAAKAYFEQ